MDNLSKIKKISIKDSATILEALKLMDSAEKKMLLVFQQDVFTGVLSIGDIQRAILKGEEFSVRIGNILRKKITLGKTSNTISDIKKEMLDKKIECMPVVNEKGELVNVHFWEDFFSKEVKRNKESLNCPVVIMAGGKGTRLKPITNIIPKPLIPIGTKTIIEEIMDCFVGIGCKDYYLSVNYKVETIKHYFDQLKNPNYNINYFQEPKPLGTAGSMYLLKGKIKKTFFVSNCDILINQDLEDIYNYHKKNNNAITMVSALKHFKIPYGTIKTGKKGMFKEMTEKPELTYQINTGVYILEPFVLDFIPENTFYHITDLIENIHERGHNVGVFPISEGSWKDIGQWDEYLKMIGK